MNAMRCPTLAEMFVLASEKRQRFMAHVRTTYVLPRHHLIRIAKSKDSYSPLLRAATLRNLVSTAPLEVTQGRCYPERRRLVRAHYGI